MLAEKECPGCNYPMTPKPAKSFASGKEISERWECENGCKNPNDDRYPLTVFPPRPPKGQARQRPQAAPGAANGPRPSQQSSGEALRLQAAVAALECAVRCRAASEPESFTIQRARLFLAEFLIPVVKNQPVPPPEPVDEFEPGAGF